MRRSPTPRERRTPDEALLRAGMVGIALVAAATAALALVGAVIVALVAVSY